MPSELRYFLALPVCDAARPALQQLRLPARPGVRLIGSDEFHLTLHYLGAITESDVNTMVAALDASAWRSPSVTIDRLGVFPETGRPTVFWAELDLSNDLTELWKSVASVLEQAINFQPESRPYNPHLTLARCDDAQIEIDDIFSSTQLETPIGPLYFDQLVLFSSQRRDSDFYYDPRFIKSLQ